jgi:hypothetical protein
MDPYIPHLSSPVCADSKSKKKARGWWRTALSLLSFIGAIFLVFVLEDVRAETQVEARGEVIVYREVPKRSAVRKGHPESPVTVDAGAAAKHMSPLNDDSLLQVNTEKPTKPGEDARRLSAGSHSGVHGGNGGHQYGRGAGSLSQWVKGPTVARTVTRAVGAVGEKVNSSINSLGHSMPSTNTSFNPR